MTNGYLLIPRHWHVVEITGPDARDFLHRITSANFRNLADGTWAEGALLAATGKIQLYFRAYAENGQTFRIFTPWDLNPAFNCFDKMHFGEKLTITPMTWEQFRVEHGIPTHPNEINDGVNPLEIGLEGAVHENKGCYPGQEVIEKIRSYGKLSRRLVLVGGAGGAPSSPATVLTVGDGGAPRDVGTLTSAVESARDKNRWIGLALLQRAALEQGTTFTLAHGGTAVELRS